MKKSIKKLLVISQVLGWSALVASACTDDQLKTNSPTTANTDSNKDQSTDSSNPSNQNVSEPKQNETTNLKGTNEQASDMGASHTDASKNEKEQVHTDGDNGATKAGAKPAATEKEGSMTMGSAGDEQDKSQTHDSSQPSVGNQPTSTQETEQDPMHSTGGGTTTTTHPENMETAKPKGQEEVSGGSPTVTSTPNEPNKDGTRMPHEVTGSGTEGPDSSKS